MDGVLAYAQRPGKCLKCLASSFADGAQRYNTQLLSIFMDKHQSQSLIDHELLTAPTSDGSLKRVAAFGWYAGGEPSCLIHVCIWAYS